MWILECDCKTVLTERVVNGFMNALMLLTQADMMKVNNGGLKPRELVFFSIAENVVLLSSF